MIVSMEPRNKTETLNSAQCGHFNSDLFIVAHSLHYGETVGNVETESLLNISWSID